MLASFPRYMRVRLLAVRSMENVNTTSERERFRKEVPCSRNAENTCWIAYNGFLRFIMKYKTIELDAKHKIKTTQTIFENTLTRVSHDGKILQLKREAYIMH